MQTTIQNDFLSATIKHRGAELSVLEKDGKNYIWDIDRHFWDKTSPVLFPIIGGLKNGVFQYKDEIYPLPRHGFAREQDFQLVSKEEDSVVFSLKSDEFSREIYPFDFELIITYRLIETELFVQYTIHNTGAGKMYYSIGAHPAFRTEGDFTAYALEFENEVPLVTYRLQDDGLFSGETEMIPLKDKRLHLNYNIFDKDALVLKNHPTASLTLLYQNKPQLQVKFKDFPYLGIWTKRDAPFICIEPWRGIADHENASGKIEEKEGIEVLDAHAERNFEWSVKVF